MTSQKVALTTTLARTDTPRRESLRNELARSKPTGRRAGLKPKLVLASASPRRLMLLGQVGIEPDALRPSSIDEQPFKGEMPRSLVTRLARAKAETARDQIANDKDVADAYVLAADTVVAVGRRILVKPRFVEEEVATLQLLSGRNHRVITGLCLITPDDRLRLKIIDTRVRFKRLSKEEVEAYIASREWRGKAGGYAIQGLAGCFVQKLTGSYTNVVGLPLTEVVSMLLGEGFPIHFNWLKLGEADPGVTWARSPPTSLEQLCRNAGLPHTRGRNKDAISAAPTATGTAMKSTAVTVIATPSIRKAMSATNTVVATKTPTPNSQDRHPVMTVVLPLRVMTIMDGLQPQDRLLVLARPAGSDRRLSVAHAFLHSKTAWTGQCTNDYSALE